MKPTASDHLIAFLLSSRSTRVYRKKLWSRVHDRKKELSRGGFNQHLYRLVKNKIIKTEGEEIYINRKNLVSFLVKKNSVIRNIHPHKSEKILISFDIPEVHKKARDWLRNQIKYWDFEMIHQSLWLGYGPLPQEFYSRVRLLNIEGNIKIFRLKRAT